MDKAREARNVDTNRIEIKKVLNALLLDGYEYEGTREHAGLYPEDIIADFSKELSYTDTAGNWINDSKIKVSIQFEKRADYAHIKKEANGDDVYVGNSGTFISDIIDEIKNETVNLCKRC